VASASHMNALTKDFMEMHKNPVPVQVGSSLKFLLVRPSCALFLAMPQSTMVLPNYRL
jgi:hypothetical protein